MRNAKEDSEYYYSHKDARLNTMREYYSRNKKKINKKTQRWYVENKKDPVFQKKRKEWTRRYYINNRDKVLKRSKERWEISRNKLLDFFGRKCKRCKFSDRRALQVDHINGGGRAEVRNSKFRDPFRYLNHIKKNPKKYQLLCANCNWIKKCENKEYKKR